MGERASHAISRVHGLEDQRVDRFQKTTKTPENRVVLVVIRYENSNKLFTFQLYLRPWESNGDGLVHLVEEILKGIPVLKQCTVIESCYESD